MFHRKPNNFKNVKYEILNKNNKSTIFEDSLPKIPWRALCFAFFLCMAGVCLLATGCLLVSGQIDAKYADRTWPLIILGLLMFLPGAYHVHIAYCAYYKVPGYSFQDIPEFD